MGLPRIVRGALVVGLLSTLHGFPVFGNPPAPVAPKKAYDPVAATDAALAAFQRGDTKALDAMSVGEVDPWIVATMLLERGEAKAAAALAAAAPRPDTQALPAYAAKYAVGPKDSTLRAALKSSADALGAGKASEAIAICDGALREAKGLLRVQHLHARALARYREQRFREAAEDFANAGAEAEALGWFKRAATLYDRAGLAWLEVGENAEALSVFEREVALDERRQVPEHLVTSLSHLATASGRIGDPERVISLQERAIPLAEGVGDRKTLLVLLNNQGFALRLVGRARDAFAMHERAGVVAQGLGDREGGAKSAWGCGLALRELGDAPGALSALGAALETYVAMKSRARAVEVRLHISPLQRLLGDRAAARETAVEGLSEAQDLKDEVLLAQARTCMANALFAEGSLAEAKGLLDLARVVQEKRGPPGDLVLTLKSLAITCADLRELSQALAAGTDAVTLARAKGSAKELAIALDGLAQVRFALWEPDLTIELAEEALALYERLGNAHGVAGAWDRIGRAKVALGDATAGLALIERARAEFERRGDVFRVAMAESTIGQVHEDRGAWVLATAHRERALAMLQQQGAEIWAGWEMARLGRIWRSRGEFGRALASYGAAEALLAREASGWNLAALQTDLAWIWETLGEPARALALRQRAAEGFERARAPDDALLERIAVAVLHAALGEVAAALADAARCGVLLEGVRDPEDRATGWGRLAQVHAKAGELPKALALALKALGQLDGHQDPLPLAFGHQRVAGILLRMDRFSDALASATTARDLFVRAGRTDQVGHAEGDRAVAMSRLGRHPEAMAASRAAIERLRGSQRGLGDEESALGWGKASRRPFLVGLEAAVATDRPADAVWFLESVRGHALLEMFAVRDTLRDAVLPPALREAEIEARARTSAAGEAMRRATKRADAAAFDRARAARDRAEGDLAGVGARMEREAKQAASLASPTPVTLAAIQAWIQQRERTEAIVLYGSTTTRVVAVVIEAAGARLVPLASTEEVAAACGALRADDPAAETSKAAATLRALLVDPLGIGPAVKRLILAPDEALAFVPFSLLDHDREIVLVPSATVLVLLGAEAPKKGEGVLALGDPAYRSTTGTSAVALLRSASLALPLPHSREEALEVGTEVLLGERATPAALREHLSKRRWRAVHFACHGLLDAERPALSGLALTPVGDDDGTLRVLDVFRLKVDADLVVLSACETARGKVLNGEGVLGLTRAFLHAGAPRVIASLWKVDDAATRALMSKFYARWAEGSSPAAALRDAQAFVASHSAWKHPHYWAAWTLWGLLSGSAR